MFFFLISTWRVYLLTIVIQQFEGSLALPDIVSRGVGRSDLFLDDTFFIGSPPDVGGIEETFGDSALGHSRSFADVVLQSRIAVNGAPSEDASALSVSGITSGLRGRKGGDDESESSEGSEDDWPGRQVNKSLANSGSKVVEQFTKNLAERVKETDKLINAKNSSEYIAANSECHKSCEYDSRTPSAFSICLMVCSAERNKLLRTAGYALYYGMKTLCHRTDTLYMKLDEVNINNLQVFQKVMQLAMEEVRQPISMNLLLRSTLMRLTNELKRSTLSAFRGLEYQYSYPLSKTDVELGLTGKVLVGAHPGCSIINTERAADKIMEISWRDPSLVDYIAFQGYVLFTGITKYMDEFPTKKLFAVVNEGLDMIIHTSCGLYEYGLNYQTLDCDQYGAYPVLDMPVPKYMLNVELHEECKEIMKSILMKRRGGSGGGGVPQPGDKAVKKGRKRRSLMVGRRNSGSK